MSFSLESFGIAQNGLPVERCTLSSSRCSISVLTRGATLQKVIVPSRKGPVDILLGCDTLKQYESQDCYLGAFVGRVANRIAGGSFTMNGKLYSLYRNNGLNTLHGGKSGWDKRIFTLLHQSETSFQLGLVSPDGEEGFPGKIDLTVTYSLLEDGFALDWQGISDFSSPFAPTCHAYWNLSGHNNGSILDHQLQIFSDNYTPINDYLIPTGKLAKTSGSPFDFTQPKPIGQDISCGHPQLVAANGYDHNFIINGSAGILRPAACAHSSKTGIAMNMLTTLPGIQLYTGNFLQTSAKAGGSYGKNDGFCLEPQCYPNFVNCSSFPQAVLKPGTPCCQRTEWHFAAD